MEVEGGHRLMQALAAKRNAIIREWLARTLQTYPEQTSRFLAHEKDPFRNPVGHTIREAFPVLFDALLGGTDAARVMPVLDGIVRIRAVQDFTAGQAVAFIFLLKRVIRDALKRPPHPPLSPRGGEDDEEGAAWAEALAAVEARIDQMSLLAFDLFMKCRERMYEIRTNEARRRMFLLERMHGLDPSADVRGSDVSSESQPCGSGLT
jgi:hypothetical protein